MGVLPCEQGRKGHFIQKDLYVQGYKSMKEHGTCGVLQLSYSGRITHFPCLSLPIRKMEVTMAFTE